MKLMTVAVVVGLMSGVASAVSKKVV